MLLIVRCECTDAAVGEEGRRDLDERSVGSGGAGGIGGGAKFGLTVPSPPFDS